MRHLSKMTSLCLAAVTVLLCWNGVEAGTRIDSNTFGALRARAIGPAVMSGRISALDAVQEKSLTIYVGAATGGVWKSIDSGTTFKPIFDEYTQSIGAIRIDPGDPKTVWVGTGESWTRNSTSVGTGLYKSTDGGRSWKLTGLEKSERIADILVSPTDGNIVYVCATGRLWSSGGERGVYKTIDGGKSWEAVLTVDGETGCADISMDAKQPDTLFAATWQFRRQPWTFSSGGPGSGLYKTTDGGKNWKPVTQGLPEGELGRIAVAVAPSDPKIVYATVEAKDTALYRSEDGGESWAKVNSSFLVRARPFYFSVLTVDPTDSDILYKPSLMLGISTDGGKSFNSMFSGGFGGAVHPDHHALWVNPSDPRLVLLGTDGGLYISRDQGHHFQHVRSLPVSQFYRVSYDMDYPYNVYGGLQDNGSWRGPSASGGGIENRDWENVGFGDGFYVWKDPGDPELLYSEYQGGEIQRLNLTTGEYKEIKPYPAAGEPKYRFHWNAPIIVSRHYDGTLYFGAQKLLRTMDRGESWEELSGDLTTNDPDKLKQEESGGLTIDNSTAENHCTIYTISESPLDPALLWVGTDDGNLQVTRNGGKSWTNVIKNVPGLPPNTWVTGVDASNHDRGTAYITFDGHRTGDMETYVYRTTDYGESFSTLTTDQIEGYALVIREDLQNRELLFLGTEFGLYISLDGGANWARFKGDLPKVGVRDLAIHPRENDLIIGTHGRGIFILDDLTPIRSLTSQILGSKVALLPARPAIQRLSGGGQGWPGGDEFVGRNPRAAVAITYYLKRRHIFGDLKLEIYSPDGELLKTLPGGKQKGINRVYWPMRLEPPKIAPASSLVPAFAGPRVAEGSYRIKLIKGKKSYEAEYEVRADPRSPHSPEERRLQYETSMNLYRMLERLTYRVDSLVDLRDQANARAEGLPKESGLRKQLSGYAKELDDFRASIVATSDAGWLSGEEKLRERLGALYGGVVGYDGKPSRSQLDRMVVLEAQLAKAEKAHATLTGSPVEELNNSLASGGLEPLRLMRQEDWKKEKS